MHNPDLIVNDSLFMKNMSEIFNKLSFYTKIFQVHLEWSKIHLKG